MFVNKATLSSCLAASCTSIPFPHLATANKVKQNHSLVFVTYIFANRRCLGIIFGLRKTEISQEGRKEIESGKHEAHLRYHHSRRDESGFLFFWETSCARRHPGSAELRRTPCPWSSRCQAVHLQKRSPPTTAAFVADRDATKKKLAWVYVIYIRGGAKYHYLGFAL